MAVWERRARILGILEQRLSVRTSSLARQFGVTEATIRRDLERLEQGGLVERSHGGALALRARRIYDPAALPGRHMLLDHGLGERPWGGRQ